MLPLTVPAVLRAAASDSADVEAIVSGDVRLTFAQLQEQVTAFARAALADGVGPGDRVAVWAPNTDRWVIAALGALSVGAVLVPVNTRFKVEEVQHVLGATGRAFFGFADPSSTPAAWRCSTVQAICRTC